MLNKVRYFFLNPAFLSVFKVSVLFKIAFNFLLLMFFCDCYPVVSTKCINNVNITQNSVKLHFCCNKDVKLKSFLLKNPDRAVMDFSSHVSIPNMDSNKLVVSPIKNIRVGESKNHHTRLVFDLDAPVKILITEHKSSLSEKYCFIDFLITQVDGGIQKFSIEKNTLIGSAASNSIKFETNDDNTVSKSHKEIEKEVPKHINYYNTEKSKIIIIDPGHGGRDSGAIGVKGLQEKDIVLDIAKKICSALNQSKNIKAIMTRESDFYINLSDRLSIARKYKPDLFISIHADAFAREGAKGSSVYALSENGATSAAAKWLAKKENSSELMGGIDLSEQDWSLKSVLLNLSQNASIRSSLTLGNKILVNLSKIGSLHSRKVEQAGFIVLKSPDIPSLLIETGFLSNYEEESKLRSLSYRKKIAQIIADSIVDYFNN